MRRYFASCGIAILFGALCAAGVGCQKDSGPSAAQESTPPEVSPLGQLRQSISERYRLKPDTRCLAAIDVIQSFVAGQEAAKAQAEFGQSAWHVSVNGAPVGALPEFPSFPDLLALLDGWARRQIAQKPLTLTNATPDTALSEIGGLLDSFYSPHLCEAGRKINDAWTTYGPDARLLVAAARMYALLAAQHLDTLGSYEEVHSRAMAFLALAKCASSDRCAESEALTAWEMGYTNHAAATVQQLHPLSPVRLFMLREFTTLAELAGSGACDALGRYMYVCGLTYGNDASKVLAFADKEFNKDRDVLLPYCKAALETNSYLLVQEMAPTMPVFATLGLGLAADQVAKEDASQVRVIESLAKKDIPGLTADFEGYAKEIERLYTGPVMNAACVRSYFESHFISGLAGTGIHALYRSNYLPDARVLSGYIDGCQGTFAEEFGKWYRQLVAINGGKADIAGVARYLGGMQRAGVAAVDYIFSGLDPYARFASIENLECAATIASRLDTRPQGRAVFARAAATLLCDTAVMERLRTSSLDDASWTATSLAAWQAHYGGNVDQLRELLRRPGLLPGVKAEILNYLAKLVKPPDDSVDAGFKALIAECPESWNAYAYYYTFLKAQNRNDQAITVMRDWLKRKVKTFGLNDIHAHCNIAEIYYAQGAYDKAREAIQPVIDSAAFTVVSLRARILLKLGKDMEALNAARFLLDRYETAPEALAEFCGVCWKTRRYTAAADAIREKLPSIQTMSWRQYLWPKLAEALDGADENEWRAAVNTIIDAGLTQDPLTPLAYQLGVSGKASLAIEMLNQLYKKTPSRKDLLVIAYNYYKKIGKAAEGLQWIKDNLPENERNRVGWVILREKCCELLWDLIERPEAGPNPEYIWLYRAVAAAEVGPQNDPHYAELAVYLAPTGKGYYHDLARILAGLEPQQKAYQIAKTADQVCELGCFMGVLALSENRVSDAVEWFRTAVETRRRNNFEFMWASEKLFQIAGKNQSLARLATADATQLSPNETQ